MSFALARKEIREHGIVLAAAYLFGLLLLFGMLAQAQQLLGGRFVGLMRFSLLFAPLLALVLANRLFVREYAGRTQLYLETLPIGRLRVFATKWLLGAVLILLPALVACWAAWRFVGRNEVLAFADVRGPLLAVLCFWFSVWSFAALGGMLGRYRYVVWLAILGVLYLTGSVAGIPSFELPILRLLAVDVQMATGTPEPAAFLHAGIAIVLLTGAAVALALLGSGGLASTLARRMTARERVFVIVTLLALITLSSLLERQPEPPPFAIVEGERVEGRYVDVGVLPTADFPAPAARSLAAAVAGDVDSLIETLAIGIEPPVFILPQRGIDRHALELGALNGASGIVLRMAPDSPLDMVRTLVLHSLLNDATLGRGMRDDRHVLLDGLAAWWALRDDDSARTLWWRRAAALPEPITATRLTDWSATSERFGDCMALALAFNVVDALVADLGEEPAQALLGRILREPPDDARVLFETGPRRLLARHDLDWETLAARAEASRQDLRRRNPSWAGAWPGVEASVDWRRSVERGTEIETNVTGDTAYTAYYGQLGPWSDQIGGLPRFDVAGGPAVLPVAPPVGARMLVVVEVDSAALDCPVRLLARRLTIE